MPVDLGVHLVGPHLPEFNRRFPDISLNIDLSARNSDLISDQVDIAIRLGKVQGDQLITRRIGSIDLKLYASPGYLDSHGRPTHPRELEQHICLLTGGNGKKLIWRLQSDGESINVPVQGPIKANNLGFLKLLAEKDMGIACVAPILIKSSLGKGLLEPVLSAWAFRNLPISAVMNSRLQPEAVSVFLEFIQQWLIAVD